MSMYEFFNTLIYKYTYYFRALNYNEYNKYFQININLLPKQNKIKLLKICFLVNLYVIQLILKSFYWL